MGKKKRGKQPFQPTTNKFWAKVAKTQNQSPGYDIIHPQPPNPDSYMQIPPMSPGSYIVDDHTSSNPDSNSDQVSFNSVEKFETPHQFQDSMLDLTDDTSPNIPISSTSSGQLQAPGITGIQLQNPQESKSPIVFGLSPTLQNKADERSSQSGNKAAKSGRNTLQKAVVEGVASNIKLFNTKVILNSSTTVDRGGKAISTRITRLPTQTMLPTKTKQYRLPAPQPGLNLEPPPQNEQPALLTPNIGQNPNFGQTQHHSGSIRGLNMFNYMFPTKGIPRSFLMQKPENDQPENPFSSMMQNIVGQAWAQVPQQPQMVHTNTPTQSNPSFVYDYKPNTQEPENEFGEPAAEPFMEQQAYSPSDAYADSMMENTETHEGSESPDLLEPGQKRLSAFRRLGPLTQPKKPKMTINLLCNKEQSVREVVDETEQKYVPVHLREDIINSDNELIVKYLKFWPWEKGLPVKKTVMPRASKSVMLLEHEQMEDIYEKGFIFIQISVQGYPRDWTMERLLDNLLDVVNGKSFVPLFIEFAPQECKFLVLKARAALNIFHKTGLIVRVDGAELTLAISQTELNTTKCDFFPKVILKKLLSMGYDGERSLDLSNFTTKDDFSHFMYYPLSRVNNQTDLIQLKSTIVWNYLTELNLSHNKLTSIDGFLLSVTTPKLQHLDLSYNCIEKATLLLRCRELALRSIKLEGNPLCRDYTDPARYVTVLKMMFSALTEIDGIKITRHGDLPQSIRNYCPADAKNIIDKFLEVYFPLLDAEDKDRAAIEQLYHEKASMTITYRYRLRYSPIYRQFRTIFNGSRILDEGEIESTDGAPEIARLINQWPPLKHDPFTFNVDVMHHDDFTTVFKVAGLVKLTSDSLADDEHLISFVRTLVLHTDDEVEYKITNEMVYWDQPTKEYANTAFQITTVRPERLSLKMETPPNEDLKEKLVEIFMQVTDLNKTASERCLEHRDWNLNGALEYFITLVKLNEIDILLKGI